MNKELRDKIETALHENVNKWITHNMTTRELAEKITAAIEVKPSPEPEMWINEYPNMPDSHMGKHPKNSNCKTLGCAPCVAEDKNNPKIVKEDWVKAGQSVLVYDRYRFAIPLKAVIKQIADKNDGVRVRLMESNNVEYPIGSDNVWVSRYQCRPIVESILEPAPAVKLPEGFESHKISKGDFVKISFNGAQLTLSHNAEVLYVPVEFGDYWILKDVYTGDVHYVSELCTITKLFEKKGV